MWEDYSQPCIPMSNGTEVLEANMTSGFAHQVKRREQVAIIAWRSCKAQIDSHRPGMDLQESSQNHFGPIYNL